MLDHARRCSEPRSDGRALPGITANGTPNSAASRPAYRSTLTDMTVAVGEARHNWTLVQLLLLV